MDCLIFVWTSSITGKFPIVKLSQFESFFFQIYWRFTHRILLDFSLFPLAWRWPHTMVGHLLICLVDQWWTKQSYHTFKNGWLTFYWQFSRRIWCFHYLSTFWLLWNLWSWSTCWIFCIYLLILCYQVKSLNPTIFIIFWIFLYFREPREVKSVDIRVTSFKRLLWNLVEPLFEMVKTLLKSRPFGRRSLILIQVMCYGLCKFVTEEGTLRYVYLKIKFPGFTGTDYSNFTLFKTLMDFCTLSLLVPLLSRKLQIHEGLLSFVALLLTSLGYIWAAFSTAIWQFYLAHVISWKFSFQKLPTSF